MATSKVVLDVTQYVRVNAGLNPLVLQAHRDSVRVAMSELQPAKSNAAFHMIGGKDAPFSLPVIDSNVWVLAESDTSSLIVTEVEKQAVALQWSSDFMIEVSKGNIPGHEALFVIGVADSSVGATYTDVWDEGGVRTLITSAESWELFSENANDTAAGIGATAVQIRSLDANYELQTSIVVTNGGAVAIPGTHRASRVIQVVGAGSNNVNVGDLVVRVSGGGGAVRQRVKADEGRANNSFFTVPANTVALPIQVSYFSPKNEDAVIRPRINIGGLGNVVTSNGFIPTYQSTARNTILASAALPAESNFWFQAKSPNPDSTVVVHSEFLIVDVANVDLSAQMQSW